MPVAIAYKQSGGGSTSSTANIVAAAFAAPTSVGNLIVVTTNAGGTANVITSITDTALNTYVKVFSVANNNAVSLDIWYAANISAVGSNVVTAHRVSAAAGTIIAAEYTGVASAAPLDVSTNAPGASTAAAASGTTATTVQANELVIGAVGSGVLGTTSATLGSGFTNLLLQSISGNFVAQESKVAPAIGTQSAAFTLNSASDYWVCGCVVFRGASVPLNRYLGATQAVIHSYDY